MKGIRLEYDFKYCPACGALISTPVHMSLVLNEPELGFGGDTSIDYDAAGCVRLLCDACYEGSGRLAA